MRVVHLNTLSTVTTAGNPDNGDEGVNLICPRDGSVLARTEAGDFQICSTCGAKFPVVGGVVRFIDGESGFYETAYFNHIKYLPRSERWLHVFPLWIINGGYLWKVRRHVPESSVVLELGCACGVDYFARRYRMIGLDLSLTALKRTAERYAECLQADARDRIPISDGSVDAVVSSYFWEHIPPEEKPSILRECRRVLKPGGKLVFLFDVATENGMIGLVKKQDPDLYRRLFIEGDGHLGYQTPGENRDLFVGGGFTIEEFFGMERTWIQSRSVYEKLRHTPGMIGIVGRIGSVVENKLFQYIHMLLVLLVDNTIGRIFPEERSRIVMVVARKGF